MPVSVYWGQNDWFSAEVDYNRMLDEVDAVFIAQVVWLSGRPEISLPRGAVRPLPNSLLLDVVTSDPGPIKVSFCQAFQDELLGGIGVHRGQMASLSTTKVLSRSPVLLLDAEEVAMVSVRLPTFRAGFDAFVLAAG